jgi:tetratricopeptide (TPR) repeat protein
VAWLFFVGTLVPALGFFNVYPMRYSFVADHFQYHATLGMLALAGAGLAWVGRRVGKEASVAGVAVILAVLGAGTFARGFVYQSARALWTDTARKNPGSWMVHVNLGHTLVEANELDAAQREYEEAARLAPEQPEALINVGGMLSKRGHYDEAMAEYRKALGVRPNYPPALYGIGDALLSQGKPAEARDWLERAVKEDPTYEQAQYKLGVAREKLGDLEGARAAYEASAAADPEEADAMYNLGNLYLSHRAPDVAAYWFGRAVAVRPGWAQAHANLGSALWQMGRRQEAVTEYATAARLDPQLGQGIRAFLARQGIHLPDGSSSGARQ